MDRLKIFTKWEERSAVRNAPKRMVSNAPEKHFFSAKLAPVLLHPNLQILSENSLRKIEIQFLYKYLQFTEYLEINLVNPVIVSIINNELPIVFNESLRKEAYKIYCDEAYHALQAHDTIDQIKALSGESPLALPIALQKRLALLKAACPLHLRPLFDLFFVCISETLVSNELSKHALDDAIHQDIQAIMADHAKDEAAHALFFETIIILLKEKLPTADFNWFLSQIPLFLDAYLSPDKDCFLMIFQPFVATEILPKMLDDMLNPEQIKSYIAEAAVPLFRILQRI